MKFYAETILLLMIVCNQLTFNFTGACTKFDNPCCYNQYINLTNKSCRECPPGTFGWNCNQTCPSGFYGRLCQSPCDCPVSVCHPVRGCLTGEEQETIKISSLQLMTEFTTRSREKECPRGSFGINCKLQCMPGYYGDLCRLPCECYAHQCDPESGCKGTISPTQEEHNNTSTWTLVIVFIIGSVATLLISCICPYLWISKRCTPRLRYPNTNPTDLDDTLTVQVVNTCKQSPDHAEICDTLNSSLSQSKDGEFTTTESDVMCKHEIEYVEKEEKYGGLPEDGEYNRLQLKTNISLKRQYIRRKDKDSEKFLALKRVEFSGVNTEDQFYSIPQMSQNENKWANPSQIDSLCTSEYDVLSIDNISPKTFPNFKEMPSISVENELKGTPVIVGEPQYSLVKLCNIEDDRNKSAESQTTHL